MVPNNEGSMEIVAKRDGQPFRRAIGCASPPPPLNERTEIFGSERLTGALLDRLTHHVYILEISGDSYRLEHSKKARQPSAGPSS